MPENLTALAVVVLFFVPGYIAALTFIRNAPYAEPKDLGFVLQIAVWAAVVHALAYPATAPLIQAWREDPFLSRQTLQFLAWFVGVVLVGPAVLGIVLGQLVRTPSGQKVLARFGMSLVDRSPTAWDVGFGPGRPGAWVKVRAREEGKSVWIGGKLGSSSAAGVSPHPHDLFRGSLGIGPERPVRAAAPDDRGRVDRRRPHRLRGALSWLRARWQKRRKSTYRDPAKDRRRLVRRPTLARVPHGR